MWEINKKSPKIHEYLNILKKWMNIGIFLSTCE